MVAMRPYELKNKSGRLPTIRVPGGIGNSVLVKETPDDMYLGLMIGNV